jgi:predicted RNase H-like HicB family nuclease
MATYRVAYWRDEAGWWIAELRGEPKGVHSNGRTIADARRRVRDALALALDDERAAETAEFDEHIVLPMGADRKVALANAARKNAEAKAREAQERTAAAIRDLSARAGLSVRDIAELLGLSHQRVQQVAAAHRRRVRGEAKGTRRPPRRRVGAGR